MNWKLILRLSLFGLAMGLATVYLIPPLLEPLPWLLIFIICALAIARRAPGNYFAHGLLTGIVNSVWITAAHVLLFPTYIARHAQEAEMMRDMPLAPKAVMMITGPLIGVVSGAMMGILAIVAHRLISTRQT